RARARGRGAPPPSLIIAADAARRFPRNSGNVAPPPGGGHMLRDITTGNRFTLLAAFALFAQACGGDSDGGGGDGGGTQTGSSHGSVGAGEGAGGKASGCFEVFPGSWSLQATAGPSQCNGFGPIDVDVSQMACTVTLSSD